MTSQYFSFSHSKKEKKRKMSNNTNNSSTEDQIFDKTKSKDTVEVERVVSALIERLGCHDENRREVQEKLHSVCEKWRKEIDDLEDKINSELEVRFKEEDSRIQAVLHDLRTVAAEGNDTNISEALQKAKAELLVVQKYNLKGENGSLSLSDRFALSTEKDVYFEWFSTSKPTKLSVTKTHAGRVFLSFTRNTEQERVLAENCHETITYKSLFQKKGVEGEKEYTLKKEGDCFSFVPEFLEAETTYNVKVRAVFKEKESEWSDDAELTTPGLSECCVWKECPD